jgi:hypothetical protein
LEIIWKEVNVTYFKTLSQYWTKLEKPSIPIHDTTALNKNSVRHSHEWKTGMSNISSPHCSVQRKWFHLNDIQIATEPFIHCDIDVIDSVSITSCVVIRAYDRLEIRKINNSLSDLWHNSNIWQRPQQIKIACIKH